MTTTSATSSATASIVATLGAGSGIDMTALATNLANASFAARTDRLTTRVETLDRQISAASSIRNMLVSLSSSLGQRVREGDLSPQPQITNAAVARLGLSGTRQPAGSYALEVTALARGQSLASPAFAASTATVGAGTLTLRFGTVSPGSFAADAAHPDLTLAIAAGSTLADVASAINGANAGVSAYVATTAAGAQLVFKGAEGAANGFIIEAAEDPANPGLAALAWEPATGAPGRLASSAGDAAFTVDGLAMTAASNSVADAIPGVNLTLTATNAGAPATVSFGDPAAAITTAMQDLTAALNDIARELSAATDPASGDLARDGGARTLRQTFSRLAGTVIMPNAAEDTPRTLADLGLSTQRDGTFQLDAARLAATLKADPRAAAAMFTTGLYGIYATIDGVVRDATRAANPGSLGGSLSRLSAQKTKTAAEQSKLAEAQDRLRAQLVSRFAATDSRVGASRSTLSFLQNQIAAWNAKD